MNYKNTVTGQFSQLVYFKEIFSATLMYNSDIFLNFGAPNSFEWQHLFCGIQAVKNTFF